MSYRGRAHAEALGLPVGQLGGPLAFVAAVMWEEGGCKVYSFKSRALSGWAGNWEVGLAGRARKKKFGSILNFNVSMNFRFNIWHL